MSDSDKPIVKVTVKGRYIGGALFEAKEKLGKVQHSACILLDDGESDKINKIIANAIKAEFGEKKPKKSNVWGVREGDDEEFEVTLGKEFINPKATTKNPPQVIKKIDGQIHKVTQEEGVVYAGCYVAVSVSAYAYKGDGKKIQPGASLSLRAVMFMRDGEPLGDRLDAESEFSDFDSEFSANDDSFGEEDFLSTGS